MIKVYLLTTSQPLVFEKPTNSYTKDGLYCIYEQDKGVTKIPFGNIFKIEEAYKFEQDGGAE